MLENKCLKENQDLKNKLRDMEDRSRRRNLRIDGVSESESETLEKEKKE